MAEKRVEMADLLLRGIEEVFITSINKETRTFFSQCTKFPNEDLINLNIAINDYCNDVIKERENGNPESGRPTSVSAGGIFCCKFDLDNCWYRAQVMSRDKNTKRCKVLFVDYGNVTNLSYNELIVIDPAKVPLIEHCPFGAPCHAKEFEQYPSEQIDIILDLLLNRYATVIFVEKQSRLQWLVELPRIGNNGAFWKPFSRYRRQEEAEAKSDDTASKSKKQLEEEEAEIKKLRALAERDAEGWS